MGYSRNLPMGSVIDPDVVAAIASDPEGYRARKKDLEAAITAAQAVIKEAADKRGELNTREQALNDRDAQLTAAEKRHYDAIAAFKVEQSVDAVQRAALQSAYDARIAALRVSEEDLAARSTASAVHEGETTALNAQAKSDRDAAAALLAKLKDIASWLSKLTEKLAGIG